MTRHFKKDRLHEHLKKVKDSRVARERPVRGLFAVARTIYEARKENYSAPKKRLINGCNFGGDQLPPAYFGLVQCTKRFSKNWINGS
jgi:hypothetical protein